MRAAASRLLVTLTAARSAPMIGWNDVRERSSGPEETVRDHLGPDQFGAARIDEHPTLEPLPARTTVFFTFDGAQVAGREGEPLAAALIAAGVRIFRAMPRFGDARGGYCMVGRCADCLVIVDGTPNMRACVTPVRDGLEVQTQHGLGELAGGSAGSQS